MFQYIPVTAELGWVAGLLELVVGQHRQWCELQVLQGEIYIIRIRQGAREGQ